MENKSFSSSFSVKGSENASQSSNKMVLAGADYYTDITLRLDSPAAAGVSFINPKGIERKWSVIDDSVGSENGSSLALGLGRSRSSVDTKGSSPSACTLFSAKDTEEESSTDLGLNFGLHLGDGKAPKPKKSVTGPTFDLELSLSTGPTKSENTCLTHSPAQNQTFQMSFVNGSVPPADEGSASSSWRSSSIEQQFSSVQPCYTLNPVSSGPGPVPTAADLSSITVSASKRSVTSTSELSQPSLTPRSSSSKNCQSKGCTKGARGASGFCIAHGGGWRCQKPGCNKGAEGRTVYCKAHGGGRRCQFLGCTKSAEGRTDFCIAHGGGRRCSQEECRRAARGKSGLCIRHGGGKRCQKENCTKSAEGFSGLCISHGGGRRCHFPSCSKGAQGSTMFCKAHGGGKRCTVLGCSKGAEGSTPFCKGHGGGKRCSFKGGGVCPKSVHGGTRFCVAHGGGKRCAVAECTKSARGRTDFCVRHGGGKRCKHEGCGKSAQGSTDFCKAHGGGKKCLWGQPGSEHNGPIACDRFARGQTGLCAVHSALMQDRRVHGGGTLGPAIPDPKRCKVDGVATKDTNLNALLRKNGGESISSLQKSAGHRSIKDTVLPQNSVTLPEGRVHGGHLMAMLTRGSENELDCHLPSGPGRSPLPMPHHWV